MLVNIINIVLAESQHVIVSMLACCALHFPPVHINRGKRSSELRRFSVLPLLTYCMCHQIIMCFFEKEDLFIYFRLWISEVRSRKEMATLHLRIRFQISLINCQEQPVPSNIGTKAKKCTLSFLSCWDCIHYSSQSWCAHLWLAALKLRWSFRQTFSTCSSQETLWLSNQRSA